MPSARALTGAVAVIVLLAACSEENHYVAPPPPKVTVAAPVQRPITRYLEVTGSAAGVNSADLVARVPGFVHADGAALERTQRVLDRVIGIAVLSGMIASTCLAVLFVPSFFVTVHRLTGWRAARKAGPVESVPAE